MNFHNLDKIMDNIDVHNKYLLTSIVAQRARQISEIRGVNEVEARHPGERAISLALSDLEDGNVSVQLQNETIPAAIENEIEAEEAAQKINTDAEEVHEGPENEESAAEAPEPEPSEPNEKPEEPEIEAPANPDGARE